MAQKYYGPVHYYDDAEYKGSATFNGTVYHYGETKYEGTATATFNGVVTANQDIKVKVGSDTYGVHSRLSMYDKLYYTDKPPELIGTANASNYVGYYSTQSQVDKSYSLEITRVEIRFDDNKPNKFILYYTIHDQNHGMGGDSANVIVEGDLNSSNKGDYNQQASIKYSYPTFYTKKNGSFYFPQNAKYSPVDADISAPCKVEISFTGFDPVPGNQYKYAMVCTITVPPSADTSNFYFNSNTSFNTIASTLRVKAESTNTVTFTNTITPKIDGDYYRFDGCKMNPEIAEIKLSGPL
jgi:hypothetical protein